MYVLTSKVACASRERAARKKQRLRESTGQGESAVLLNEAAASEEEADAEAEAEVHDSLGREAVVQVQPETSHFGMAHKSAGADSARVDRLKLAQKEALVLTLLNSRKR